MLTFSNPRLHAEFSDWPSGSKRVHCVFNVEYGGKRGFRISRQTTGKPKFSTYGGKAAIVDGSDGRTYLIQRCAVYEFIKVSASDFMDARKDVLGFEAACFPGHEMFPVLNAMIDQANAVAQTEQA